MDLLSSRLRNRLVIGAVQVAVVLVAGGVLLQAVSPAAPQADTTPSRAADCTGEAMRALAGAVRTGPPYGDRVGWMPVTMAGTGDQLFVVMTPAEGSRNIWLTAKDVQASLDGARLKLVGMRTVTAENVGEMRRTGTMDLYATGAGLLCRGLGGV